MERRPGHGDLGDQIDAILVDPSATYTPLGYIPQEIPQEIESLVVAQDRKLLRTLKNTMEHWPSTTQLPKETTKKAALVIIPTDGGGVHHARDGGQGSFKRLVRVSDLTRPVPHRLQPSG
jgi:hypothetical protein